jgi:hypothetical protein
MAHKLRIEMFVRLRELLEASQRSFRLYVSAANHETGSLRDAQVVADQLSEVFQERAYFLGTLSDVAISNLLGATTFFAAFFPGGVRANNTSVASAMEHGAVVITNLDRQSPPHLAHMENVIDIESCERLPLEAPVLEGLSASARDAAGELSWERLVAELRGILPGGSGA